MSGCNKPVSELLSYVCPLKWNELVPTDSWSRRWCMDCKRHVQLVQSESEYNYHVGKGECIAINLTPIAPVMGIGGRLSE